MRHHYHIMAPGLAPQSKMHALNFSWFDSEAAHASVDFEPECQRFGGGNFAEFIFQHCQIFSAMYYQLQIVMGNAAQIGFVDKALHHQDVLAGTGTPQLFGFVHRGDAEQISVVQRFSARHKPMAIGISLDHGHYWSL